LAFFRWVVELFELVDWLDVALPGAPFDPLPAVDGGQGR